jgi:predicted glycosyltransferase
LFKNKTIFIAALDWGLGHATRCIPLIRTLKQNNRIIIGVTPLTRAIFDQEFPELQKTDVPAYDIHYSRYFPVSLKLLFEYRRINAIIKSEHKLLDEIINTNGIDVVISDNRFGLHSKKVRSVFITHQLFLKTPFANSLAQKINKFYILKFDEIWIPDYEDDTRSLSGELSHGNNFHSHIKYIGPLSRLEKIKPNRSYNCVFVISGPEPQQSLLATKLIALAVRHPLSKFAMIISGKHNNINKPKNVDVFFNANSNQISELLCGAEKIICRSGYSTLMDLHHLEIKGNIILIPTPGQTEQKYLAALWQRKFNCLIVSQNKIDNFNL